MPGKVIPFRVAVRAASQEVPIKARHHIVLKVGANWYDVDLMSFVTRPPAKAEESRAVIPTGMGTERRPPVVVKVLEWSQSLRPGWRAVLSLVRNKEHSGADWRQLGIASPSPAAAADKKAKISLALGRRTSDESSCATSAQKEDHMTNVESRDTAPQEGDPVPEAAANPVKAARKGAKATSKGRKQGASEPRTAGSRAGAKSAKKGPRAPARKPRLESKGAKILQLISRAKGATLSEIMQATSWQAHSVRGFLSTAAKKQGVKIASLRNDAGARVYKLER